MGRGGKGGGLIPGVTERPSRCPKAATAKPVTIVISPDVGSWLAWAVVIKRQLALVKDLQTQHTQ